MIAKIDAEWRFQCKAEEGGGLAARRPTTTQQRRCQVSQERENMVVRFPRERS